MRATSPIQFIIIGAQKAGTTSLFEYMRHHPQIHMPPQKEIGFFSSDTNYARGWDWYSSLTLGGAPDEAVCGEGSVGYMSGTPDRRRTGDGVAKLSPDAHNGRAREDIIPERIRQYLPDVKLICVLRDPVARCLSHYRMAVLAGSEQRTFERAITEMLEAEALEEARSSITGNNGYIARGEYFRILSGFWRTFPPGQLMVRFSADLDSRPREVLESVFSFVGVSPDFVPANLGVRYREAAVVRRVPGLDLYAWQERLSRPWVLRSLWRAVPQAARTRIAGWYDRASFRVEMWNARRGELEDAVPGHVRDLLISHFRADSEALARTLGVEVPWLADWSRGSAR